MRPIDPRHSFPVAIIGMACKFPGADGHEQFWRLISDGIDAITEVPDDPLRLSFAQYPRLDSYDNAGWRRGGFIEDISAFDAKFFNIAPRQARLMDPQQRLLLETTWEALEDAGSVPASLTDRRVGVFVGHQGADYWELLLAAGQTDIHSAIGSGARSVLSGRLSHAFDFRGPSISIDTGCSSSLVAVHLACQSLRLEESTLAIAAGVNLILKPGTGIAYERASMLAHDGRCKFGEARADGFVRSEGVGVVVLKPLPAALADGDPVRAIILGSAINNDGLSSRYLFTPTAASQEELLRTAYEQAQVEPTEVDLVEAHGTGTRLGDPEEISALMTVLGRDRPDDRPLRLGSVKTNIGHTEGASGIAGLIKAVLCLQHRTAPASLHVHVPNPKIDWTASPVALCRDTSPLPYRGRPLIAGISSLGIGGTNAHVVLAECKPLADSAGDDRGTTGQKSYILPISASDPDSLAALAARYADWLRDVEANRVPLADACRSAAERRSHHRCRLAVVGSTPADLADSLADSELITGVTRAKHDNGVPEVPPQIAFVFPGQGSQWAGMGRELLGSSAAFASQLRACDEAVQREAGWSLIDQLHNDDIGRARSHIVQPLLWAMEVSLAALWRSWGVKPDLVIGHSMGEVAAAYVSGALALEDAAAIICRRSSLAMTLPVKGGMATVGLPEEETRTAIADYADRLAIGALNAPTSTVVSGDSEALNSLGQRFTRCGVRFRRIDVDYASHSPHIDLISDELRERLATVRPRPGRVPLYSTLLNQQIDGSALDAEYWVRNMRHEVRFAEVISNAAQREITFIEISPRPILVGAIRECLEQAGRRHLILSSLREGEPERAVLLDNAARLYAAGHDLRWPELNGPCRTFIRLPRYPWRRDRFWFDHHDRQAARGSDDNGPVPYQVPTGPEEIEAVVKRHIAQVLDMPTRRIDSLTRMRSLALDSLLAVEIQTLLHLEFGFTIPVSHLLGDSTVAGVVAVIIGALDPLSILLSSVEHGVP